MHLEFCQWALGALAALLVGISKTGVPGIGIMVVPLLVAAFGGRPAIGVMLPMLIMGDIFAVVWYGKHVQWDKLIRLLPWVVVGLVAGGIALKLTGDSKSTKDILGQIIGGIILLMLALYLLQGKLGEKLTPTSKVGIAGTGAVAGFTTMVSNAAGPVMSIYMAAHKLPKKEFMGTISWYFFMINASKFPVYLILSAMNPAKPIITPPSLVFNVLVFPMILLGVYIGKWMLPRISQETFEAAVLALAGIGAAIPLVRPFFG